MIDDGFSIIYLFTRGSIGLQASSTAYYITCTYPNCYPNYITPKIYQHDFTVRFYCDLSLTTDGVLLSVGPFTEDNSLDYIHLITPALTLTVSAPITPKTRHQCTSLGTPQEIAAQQLSSDWSLHRGNHQIHIYRLKS